VTVALTEPIGVGLVTRDAGTLLRFYTDVFGLQPLEPVAFPGHGTVHRLRSGRSLLRIFEPATTPTEAPRAALAAMTGIRYLTLVVDDLDRALGACRAFGIDTPEPTSVGRGLLLATVQDPEGNAIEIQGPSAQG
jgi:catechol 2,3-dioxygenase-like lactoylglutathione lyase family enzyme